jgi:uncharacterized protein YbjT (DUF2867 family)
MKQPLPTTLHNRRPIFVTGASGYIGGRLVRRLLAAGHRVRCFARSPRKLASRPWFDHPNVKIVEGDANDASALAEAMRGCGPAYYLIHSMMVVGAQYREQDRRLALSFAEAATKADISRITYLGGLGETGNGLSEHLSSRREVEEALASGAVPVTVFRAAMIIGSGSASLEILRYLVERLPVMVTSRWIGTEVQPIAARNVPHYLLACVNVRESIGKALDIGGAEVVTCRRLVEVMAEARRLARRLIIPVPVLNPRLSSLWVHLVTPVSHRIARPLAEGLRNRVVCRDGLASRLMPQTLLTVREAIDEALGGLMRSEVETAWSDAGPMPGDPSYAGGPGLVFRGMLEGIARSAERPRTSPMNATKVPE